MCTAQRCVCRGDFLGKIVSIAVGVLLTTIVAALLTLGWAYSVLDRAQVVADIAALTAADAARGLVEADPCTVAKTVITSNRENLRRCTVEGESVTVIVQIDVLGQKLGIVARAGPPV